MFFSGYLEVLIYLIQRLVVGVLKKVVKLNKTENIYEPVQRKAQSREEDLISHVSIREAASSSYDEYQYRVVTFQKGLAFKRRRKNNNWMFNSNTQIRYSPGSFFQKLAKNGAWKTTYCPKMGPGNLIQTSGSSR